MTTILKPMLAASCDEGKLSYPLLASYKIDGVRCLSIDGKPMSRSMKVIPNRHIQKYFEEHASVLEGLDGELVVGQPNDPALIRQTTSAVMAHEGEFDFGYYVFDLWDQPLPYKRRLDILLNKTLPGWVKAVPHVLVSCAEDLSALEESFLNSGFEGVMLRDPDGPYKQGRSTLREGYLLKVKRYLDTEGLIIGFEERMHNANEVFTSEIGLTKRSTHAENMVPTDSLGSFVVQGLEGTPFSGKVFNVGGGKNGSLREKDRIDFWKNRHQLLGQVIKFSYFGIGLKDLPRHPGFLAFRNSIDMC